MLITSTTGKWMALLAAFLGWMFDGLEMGLFPLVARPALQELMGGAATQSIGTWMSIVIAVFLVGAAAGGLLFGWLGDRIGRVRAMVWSVLTYAVFSGLCAFATEPWQLAILRFTASLGMGGEWSLGVALVMEIWPSSSRPMLAGLIGAAANLGMMAIALVGLGLTHFVEALAAGIRALGFPEDRVTFWIGSSHSGWRLLMLLGAAPALLTFFIRLFVPESERWREATRSAPKARVLDLFQPGLLRLTVLATCLGAIALLGTWGSVQWIPTWADQMAGGKEPAARAWTQIALSAGAVLGTVLAAYLADWFNRRTAYFALSLLSLVVCAYFFRVHVGYDGGFLLRAALVGGLTASFYGWLPLYLPEIFPTRVRATGQGFAFNFGRVLAAVGTLGSGQLVNYFKEDYGRMCSVISLVYILGLGVIWLCPETKGRPLPE